MKKNSHPLLSQPKRILFIVMLLYLSFVATLYIQQRNFIYFPDKKTPNFGTASSNLSAPISVTTQDSTPLNGYFFKPQAPNTKIILLFHGNAGHIGHRVSKIEPYLAQNYGVLLAEYRGYGGNSGTPTEDGLYEDAKAYYAWLLKEGYKSENIIFYGESLGTGVAVQLALEHPPAALILETPYARLSDPAQKTYFFIPFIEYLMKDKYASIEKISHISSPKLFLIAGKDEVLGAETGLLLYERAAPQKTLKVFENGGHNTLYRYGVEQEILHFLSTLP